MKINLKLYGSFILITGIAVLFSQCLTDKPATDPRENGYAGAAACVGCHGEISTSQFHSAHARSSSPATGASINGSFHPDSNTYHYTKDARVVMQHDGKDYYQAAFFHDSLVQKERFDIVIGSGRKAQTFLYWLDDKVYQLPVSYYVASGKWANSPNFPSGQVRFDRNIPVGCFECHSSYIKRNRIEAFGEFSIDHFNRNQVIYGIDCERCHGPSAKHVALHTDSPLVKDARYLVTYQDLPRDQQVDMCSVCHSGIRDVKRTTFFFRPGTRLADFVEPAMMAQHPDSIDVHGNQYQLFASSACYKESTSITCTSCHDPHKQQKDDLSNFSVRCMSCHTPGGPAYCGLEKKYGTQIQNNCIDCHMPEKNSRLISLQTQGDTVATPNKVRTHFIAVYKAESDKFIQKHGLSPVNFKK